MQVVTSRVSLLNRASDVMTASPFVLTMHGHTVQSLLDFVHQHRMTGFPVATSSADMLVVGSMTTRDLLGALDAEMRKGTRLETKCSFAMLEMRSVSSRLHSPCLLSPFSQSAPRLGLTTRE